MESESCDVCGEEIEFEPWTSDEVKCPKCGARYEPMSDYIDSRTGSWAFWLSRIDDDAPKPGAE